MSEKNNNSILVVDDDTAMRFAISEALKKDGYNVVTAKDGKEAIERVSKEDFAGVIMDVRMPNLNGIETLIKINAINPKIYPIVLTAYGKENVDIEKIGELAFSYFTKPFDLSHLRLTVRQAVERHKVGPDNLDSLSSFPFKELIGEGPAIRQIRRFILKVAESNVTVLVLGESGTGKELIAEAVHACSPYKNRPFVPITCSAIPETLLESELFGYEKGAFTDAKEAKPGKFEQANGGSIFLDEIGDMSLVLQAKFLRVLEEKKIERLGGTKTVPVNVRIIAATNKDLLTEVREKRFREDLYYRINVISIYLPPLRKRREDIPLLLEYFIQKFNQELNRSIEGISIEALELLVNYPWPGNIRELENILKRAIVLETANILSKESLAPLVAEALAPKDIDLTDMGNYISLSEAVKGATGKIEKQLIQQALAKNKGNCSSAAKELGISRKTLYNKMKEHNLSE